PATSHTNNVSSTSNPTIRPPPPPWINSRLHYTTHHAIRSTRLHIPPPSGIIQSARACSSVGRTLHSHCRGQRFESAQVHPRHPLRVVFIASAVQTAPYLDACPAPRYSTL